MMSTQQQAVNIIWPEERSVPMAKIHTWYSDAVANCECDELPDPHTIQDEAGALHLAGLITLGKDRDESVRERWGRDPIRFHHPECGCARCVYGEDQALWAFHPSEY